jgi:hypothetical protein
MCTGLSAGAYRVGFIYVWKCKLFTKMKDFPSFYVVRKVVLG